MNQQILVISDLKESTSAILETAIHLAKSLNKELFFLSVSKPTHIVKNESQLSAIRNINYAHCKTVDEIEKLIKPISKVHKIKIDFKHVIGNVKKEVLNHINLLNPEIVVLGKRKPKRVNLNGDKLTDFVLKNYKGVVILADKNAKMIDSKKYPLAILSDPISKEGKTLVNSLCYAARSKEETNLSFTVDQINQLSIDSQRETIAKLKDKNYGLVFINRPKGIKKIHKVISNVESSFVLTN